MDGTSSPSAPPFFSVLAASADNREIGPSGLSAPKTGLSFVVGIGLVLSHFFLLSRFIPSAPSSAHLLLYRLLADPVAREEEHKPQRNPKRAPGAGYAQQPAPPRKVRNRASRE